MVVAGIVLGSLAGLVVLVALVGLCLPRRWRIERSTKVAATPAEIFPVVNDFERGWKQWNPWVEPGTTIGYEGKPSGVGAVSTWQQGRNTGRMEIVESNPTSGVVYTVVMNSGFSMTGRFELRREGAATLVVWSDDGEVANPFLRFFPLLMKNMIGGKLSKLGLARVKALAEKKPLAV